MKIAYIIPSLANKGPILVVRDLCVELLKIGHFCDVYYFDEIIEVDFPCSTHRISFFKKINFQEYDIVHSHMYRPDMYVFLYKPFYATKTKFISTLHQHLSEHLPYNFSILKAKLITYSWLFILRRFDQIVVLSKYHKSYYEKYVNCPINIIYNGRNINYDIKIDKCDDLLINEIKRKYKLIGAAAYITERKGFVQLIKALIDLPDYALLIVGDGPGLKKLQESAIEYNVSDRCIFLGSRKEGFRYNKYIDIYAMCSYTEGYPLALIEAAAMKLPIICSDIPVLRGLLPDNCARFFLINDTSSLRSAILSCSNNSETLSSNVYSFYRSALTREIMTQNYVELYKNVMNLKNL